MNNPYEGTIKVKGGVLFHPNMLYKPYMWTMILVVRMTCPGVYTPTITSGTDGTHKRQSKHYYGDALDWRIRDYPGDSQRWAYQIQAKLGNKYYVRLEPDHIHIQYNGKARAK